MWRGGKVWSEDLYKPGLLNILTKSSLWTCRTHIMGKLRISWMSILFCLIILKHQCSVVWRNQWWEHYKAVQTLPQDELPSWHSLDNCQPATLCTSQKWVYTHLSWSGHSHILRHEMWYFWLTTVGWKSRLLLRSYCGSVIVASGPPGMLGWPLVALLHVSSDNLAH